MIHNHIIGIKEKSMLGLMSYETVIVRDCALSNENISRIGFFKVCPICGRKITPFLLGKNLVTWDIIKKQQIKE